MHPLKGVNGGCSVFCDYIGCIFCSSMYFPGLYAKEMLTLETVSVDRMGVERRVEVIVVKQTDGATSYEVTKRIHEGDGTVFRTPPRIGYGCPLVEDVYNGDLMVPFIVPLCIAELANL